MAEKTSAVLVNVSEYIQYVNKNLQLKRGVKG